jgi:hypothetical protein
MSRMKARRSHEASRRVKTLLGITLQELCRREGITRSKLYVAFVDEVARARLKKRIDMVAFAVLFPEGS